MPGKSLTPELVAEAVSLRLAGYTAAAIADRLGVGVRTLQRVFERHGIKKGEAKQELIDAARKQLIDGIASNESIKVEFARLVADDLAQAKLLRQRMAQAAEQLRANSLDEVALLMRAAAAYSTALKNTSDMVRRSLRPERVLDTEEATQVPELVIRVLGDDEAKRLSQRDGRDDYAPKSMILDVD